MIFRRRSLFLPNLGFILLGIWLIAMGAVPLLGVRVAFLSTALNILAIVAGVLLLFQGRR